MTEAIVRHLPQPVDHVIVGAGGLDFGRHDLGQRGFDRVEPVIEQSPQQIALGHDALHVALIVDDHDRPDVLLGHRLDRRGHFVVGRQSEGRRLALELGAILDLHDGGLSW